MNDHSHLFYPRAAGQYNDPADRVLTCEHTGVPFDDCDCAACDEAHAVDDGTHVVCHSCGSLTEIAEVSTLKAVTPRGTIVVERLCSSCTR